MTTAETIKAMTTATMISDDSSAKITNRCGYRQFERCWRPQVMVLTTIVNTIVVGVGVDVNMVAMSIDVDVGCDRFQRGWW